MTQPASAEDLGPRGFASPALKKFCRNSPLTPSGSGFAFELNSTLVFWHSDWRQSSSDCLDKIGIIGYVNVNRRLWTAIYGLGTAFSAVSNLCLLLTILSQAKLRRSQTHRYILMLALSNLAYCVVGTLLLVSLNVQRPSELLRLNLCRFVPYCVHAFGFVNIACCVIIAVDRYTVVIDPQKRWLKRTSGQISLFFAVVGGALGLSWPQLLYTEVLIGLNHGNQKEPFCAMLWPKKSHKLIYMATTALGSSLLGIVCVVRGGINILRSSILHVTRKHHEASTTARQTTLPNITKCD